MSAVMQTTAGDARIHELLRRRSSPYAIDPRRAITETDLRAMFEKAAVHDLGAAAAGLTFEATARGLVVHQMIGIDPERAHVVFDLAPSQEAFTALAIGYRGSAHEIPEIYAQRDAGIPVRKPLAEIIPHGML